MPCLSWQGKKNAVCFNITFGLSMQQVKRCDKYTMDDCVSKSAEECLTIKGIRSKKEAVTNFFLMVWKYGV